MVNNNFCSSPDRRGTEHRLQRDQAASLRLQSRHAGSVRFTNRCRKLQGSRSPGRSSTYLPHLKLRLVDCGLLPFCRTGEGQSRRFGSCYSLLSSWQWYTVIVPQSSCPGFDASPRTWLVLREAKVKTCLTNYVKERHVFVRRCLAILPSVQLAVLRALTCCVHDTTVFAFVFAFVERQLPLVDMVHNVRGQACCALRVRRSRQHQRLRMARNDILFCAWFRLRCHPVHWRIHSARAFDSVTLAFTACVRKIWEEFFRNQPVTKFRENWVLRSKKPDIYLETIFFPVVPGCLSAGGWQLP